MLRTIYAMLSTRNHYQAKTVDYEALSVVRNAPRWMKMLRKHGFIATPAAADPVVPGAHAAPASARPGYVVSAEGRSSH